MEERAEQSATRATTAVWTIAIAALWAAVVVFVGVGVMTTYFAAYGAGLPVLLLQSQTSPWVTVGAGSAALLLTALSIRSLGMPRVAWVGVPLGHLAVLATVWIAAAITGSMSAMYPVFVGSDVPMALLVIAAAFAGSRL